MIPERFLPDELWHVLVEWCCGDAASRFGAAPGSREAWALALASRAWRRLVDDLVEECELFGSRSGGVGAPARPGWLARRFPKLRVVHFAAARVSAAAAPRSQILKFALAGARGGVQVAVSAPSFRAAAVVDGALLGDMLLSLDVSGADDVNDAAVASVLKHCFARGSTRVIRRTLRERIARPGMSRIEWTTTERANRQNRRAAQASPSSASSSSAARTCGPRPLGPSRRRACGA